MGYCEPGNESLGPVKGGVGLFLDQLSNYYLYNFTYKANTHNNSVLYLVMYVVKRSFKTT
jgi:hypothetical protein